MIPNPPGHSFSDEELAARLQDGLRAAMLQAMVGAIDGLVAACVEVCVGRFRELQRELLCASEGDEAALGQGLSPEQPAADASAAPEVAGSSPRELAMEPEVEDIDDAQGDGQWAGGATQLFDFEELEGQRSELQSPEAVSGGAASAGRPAEGAGAAALRQIADRTLTAVALAGLAGDVAAEMQGEISAKAFEAISSRLATQPHRHAEDVLRPAAPPGLAGAAEAAPSQEADRTEPVERKEAQHYEPAPTQPRQQDERIAESNEEAEAEREEAQQSEPSPSEPDEGTVGTCDESEVMSSLGQQDCTAVQLAGQVERRHGVYSILGQQTSPEVATKIKDALKYVDESWLSTEWGTVSHRVWLVVTGRDNGGPLVRQGPELSSPICTGSHLSRLSPGTLVKQLKLVGHRLFFQRLSGSGPACGWVSTRTSGKQLLVRLFRVNPQGARGSSASADTGPAGSSSISLGECDIIPMGHYCITATLLKKHGWRRQALPLDWCAATFRVWNHMIADDFQTLLCPKGKKGEMHPYNKMFFPDVAMFIHQGGWASSDVRRRVARLKSLLAQGRAVGLAIYMDGSENCSQSLDDLVDDGRQLLELERGFCHIVLVWIEEATSNPPNSEWLASFMSSGRMSVLRYSPSCTVNYYTRLSPADSDCIASLLSERFPTAFKRRGPTEPETTTRSTPTEFEDCPGAPDSGESDAERHWGDRFDESVYWEELSRKVSESADSPSPPPLPTAPKKPVISGVLSSKKAEACKSVGAAAGSAAQDAKCQRCRATERLVFDPLKEGLCLAWDGVIYCAQCWRLWQHSDWSSGGSRTDFGGVFRSRRVMRPT